MLKLKRLMKRKEADVRGAVLAALLLALIMATGPAPASAAVAPAVDDNWAFIADNDASLSLTVGDTVRNDNDSINPGTIFKTYGVDGFGSVTTGAFTGATAGAATISDAIAATPAGATINVLEGTYTLTSAITINKSITLLGAQANVDARPSAGTTRVIGSASESIINVNGLSQGFIIAADNVEINGFDIRNATTALIDSACATAYTGARVRYNIVHNSSTSGGARGIRIAAISNAVVEYNNIFTVADAGIEIGSSSLSQVSTGAQVHFNEVHDLGSGGSTNSAIYAFSSPDTTAATIDLNATIAGNLVYNHFGNDAIKLGSKAAGGPDRNIVGGTIEDNVVHDTAQDGITVNAGSTTVQRNEVYHSFSSAGAIYVEHGGSAVSINNNYLHDNSAGLAAILIGFSGRPASPAGMAAQYNSIVNNTNNFIFFRDNIGGTGTLDASGNWYGSNSTATVTASVKSTAGATATTNRIDFTPWLNNGTDSDGATPGFQPNFAGLTVAPSTVSLQTGSTGRIDEGIGIIAVGGTVSVLTGTYTEDMTLNKAATVTLPDAALTVNGAANVAAGTLTGLGTITGSIAASGTGIIAPGLNLGTLNGGTVSLGTGSTLSIDIDTGISDQLASGGAVTLTSPTLSANLISPPTAPLVILSNGSGAPVNGTFNGLAEGAGITVSGRNFKITYAGGDGNDVALVPVYSISGYIRTKALVPIEGVIVTGTGGIGQATTDASGRYELLNVPAGNYLLTPAKTGFTFTPSAQGLTVTTSNRGANFIATSASPTYSISGRVSDSAGVAITGATVTLAPTPSQGGVINPVTTNSAGYYTFNGVPNGSYTITPGKSGTFFTPSSRNVTISGASQNGQNFIGSTGYTVSGRLQTSGGIGISGATVTLDGGATVTSNSAGYYTFANVANGDHTVVPAKAGYTFVPQQKTVTVNNVNLSGQNFTGTGP